MHQHSPSQTFSPLPPLNRHNITHRLQYLKILSNAPNPVRFDMNNNSIVSHIVNGWIMEADQMDNKFPLVSLGTAGTFLDSKPTHERAHFYSVTYLQSGAVDSWWQLAAPSVGHNQRFIGIDLQRRRRMWRVSAADIKIMREELNHSIFIYFMLPFPVLYFVWLVRERQKRVNGVIAMLHIWTCFRLVIKFSISILLTN